MPDTDLKMVMGTGGTIARAVLNLAAEVMRLDLDFVLGEGLRVTEAYDPMTDRLTYHATVVCAPLEPGASLGRTWPTGDPRTGATGPVRPQEDPAGKKATEPQPDTTQSPEQIPGQMDVYDCIKETQP